MNPKTCGPVALMLLGALTFVPARAGVFLYTWGDSNLEIPDAPGTGLPTTVSDTRMIGDNYTQVDDIAVTLNFEGSDGAGGSGTLWNGDLHVTLSHESGASVVLLNRIGRDTGTPFGSSGNGLSITLESFALQDVHLATGSGLLTGSFQPDGRSASPSDVVASSPRDAMFDGFVASMAGGFRGSDRWTLSVTDMESGNLGRLKSWSVTITGVPEPETWAWISGLGLAGWALYRRRGWRGAARA